MNLQDYKDVYVFAEQRDGVIQNVALELLGKARELADANNEKVVAILLGKDIKGKAQDLIAAGADKVLVVDHDLLATYLTEPYTQAITQIIKEQKPSILLIGATTIGRDLGPRVSARNVTGLTADATKLEISDDEAHEFRMTRPAFGGNLMATILCKQHRPQMSTVRPGVMQKMPADPSRKGEVVDYPVQFDEKKISRVKIVKTVKEEKVITDISQAKVLVSGGRGVGTKDGFSKLEALAKELKGEVSSSRAMVDAGVMEQSRQVGQTGKTVRPNLYLACGISGAIQHLAGMEESDIIIAVNRDETAPIFNVADYGVVGDLNKVVPMLTEKIRAMKAE
jgi:electron transfer flavoprotein alpha subunit